MLVDDTHEACVTNGDILGRGNPKVGIGSFSEWEPGWNGEKMWVLYQAAWVLCLWSCVVQVKSFIVLGPKQLWLLYCQNMKSVHICTAILAIFIHNFSHFSRFSERIVSQTHVCWNLCLCHLADDHIAEVHRRQLSGKYLGAAGTFLLSALKRHMRALIVHLKQWIRALVITSGRSLRSHCSFVMIVITR